MTKNLLKQNFELNLFWIIKFTEKIKFLINRTTIQNFIILLNEKIIKNVFENQLQ